MNGHYATGQKYGGKHSHIQKMFYSWWERKVAFPITQIDDKVKHIFRERSQEADHEANLGADGQRKITVDKGNNTQKLDGSKRTDGRCGCGVVIKGVDGDKSMSKIAVPLETCTAMATEVVGASGVTGILDLVLVKKPSVWRPLINVSSAVIKLP